MLAPHRRPQPQAHPTVRRALLPLLLSTSWAWSCTGDPAPNASTSPALAISAATPRVTADERGFTPARVTLRRGAAGVVLFRRTTDNTCANAVIFPALGISKSLPLLADVAIELPTHEERTLTFQCGMGMYRSQIVIR